MKSQQSPNWNTRKNIKYFLEAGFPFNEGFPRCGPTENKWFEVITRDGEHHEARVDFSTQYRTEGLQWRTRSGQLIYKHVVIAWKEKE